MKPKKDGKKLIVEPGPMVILAATMPDQKPKPLPWEFSGLRVPIIGTGKSVELRA